MKLEVIEITQALEIPAPKYTRAIGGEKARNRHKVGALPCRYIIKAQLK